MLVKTSFAMFYRGCVAFFLYLILAKNFTFSQEIVDLSPSKRLTQFPIRNWDMDKGLASDMSIRLHQCNDGYLWIATYKGISRFDGVRFTNYNFNNTEALSSVTIQGITKDSEGTLWFCSHKGIVRYKEYVFSKDPNLKELDDENVEALHFDKASNKLWIGTNSKGVFCYDFKKLEPLPSFLRISTSIVKTINSDFDGNVWIGTESGEVIRFDGKQFEELIPDERIDVVGEFYPSQLGRVWVATSNGVYSIRSNKLKKHKEIKPIRASTILEDDYNTLWIGTQQGLYRHNLITGHLDSLNEKMGIPNDLIINLLADNEGNLWGATYRKGIFRLTDGLVLNYSAYEGLSSDIIVGIAQAGPDKFYIADEYGVINTLEKGMISRFRTKTLLPKDRLKSIFIDSKENLWISTYSGLLKREPNGKEVFFNPSTGFPSLTIRLTFEDTQGNIWVGTRSDGLYKIQGNGKIDVFNHTNGLSSNYVMAVNQDKTGRIIVATKNGLHIIEDNAIIKNITTEQGLPSNFAFNVHIDTDNVFWLSSNDGIIRIEDDSSIFVYNLQNGLFDNTMFDILEDDNGFFWMPTDLGIVRISKRELNLFAKGEIPKYTYRIFDRSDGMKTQRCMGATKSFKAKDGRLFFPTNGGVSIMNPKDLDAPIYFPRVIIEDLVANGKYLSRSPIFQVPSGVSRIQINYTSIFLKSPEKISFKYRLDPFEEQWIEAGSERVARYTNLSPGTYTFSVISTNPDGEWNSTSEYAIVVVKSTWWQTLAFKFFAILLFAAVVFLLFKLRTRAIELQKVELEKQIKIRTAQIEKQKEEIQEQSIQLEKLSIVAKHTNNAILIASPDGTILWVNEAYNNIYGYTLDELKKEKGINILNIFEDSEIRKNIQWCIFKHDPITYSLQLATKYGNTIWIQTSLTPVKDERGEVRNLVAIDTDITYLKLAEQEMTNLNDEILAQTEVLLQQKEEIKAQRDELEQINTLLIRHTENIEASIWYALTIQKAILPEMKQLSDLFETFLVFKPRDIVSGDFYWFGRILDENNMVEKLFVAVVDCTGHGVPGALMSMIGSRLLNEVILERKVYLPSMILNQLNKQVNLTLKQDSSENIDGMDVALCLIENIKNTRVTLTFAGANRPLFVLRNNSQAIETIRGNRKTIGGLMPDLDAEYEDHVIELEKGDLIVMNSDGYVDQNNPLSKKFTVKQLHQIIESNRHKPLSELAEILDVSFDEYRGLAPQRDDVTVMGIRF